MCFIVRRWDVDAVYNPAAPVLKSLSGQVATRFGTFLADIHDFDAAAFGLSHAEACTMDPQQVRGLLVR